MINFVISMSPKYFIHYFILFLFSFQLLYRNCVIIMYSQYQQEIATQYCENRFNKNTECKGKCYLNKQLNDNPNSDYRHFSLSKLKSELFYQDLPNFNITILETFVKQYDFGNYQELKGIIYLKTPPPKMVNLV